MAALLDEGKKLGLGSTAHLEQRGVAQMNALTAARLGLQNLMVLYGTGHVRLNDRTGRTERVGGVRYTIKDGRSEEHTSELQSPC